jgi:hypothetical protein
MSMGRRPRIWTLDYGRVEKRVMNGAVAAWHISRQSPPKAGHMVYRLCLNTGCVNPAHLCEAEGLAEIGRHMRATKRLVGTHLDARRASIQRAIEAAGIVVTPPDVVRSIRAAPSAVSSSALARAHAMNVQTVSKIRRGESRRDVV